MADQVPPVAFVPPKASYNEDALTLVPAQITKLPLVPALAGAGVTVKFNVAVLQPAVSVSPV